MASSEASPPGRRPAVGAGSFGDRLAERVVARESQLVLGIDPSLDGLWPGVDRLAGGGSPAEQAASAVLGHCRALIDAVAPACVAVKAQLACFERLGVPGRRVLGEVLEHARELGLLTIADGKRGDIDVSAKAYAQSLFGGAVTRFGRLEGLGVDMATVNPLLGRDSVEPFVAAARQEGAAVLVLVRTSNPGAADIQDLCVSSAAGDSGGASRRTGRAATGRTVWESLAAIVAELGAGAHGRCGLADVGAVVGATAPEHLQRARELMPNAVLLLPGVGAQGGRVERLAPAFAPGRAGGLITASRSIADAHRAAGGADPAAAARREAERLREAAWAIGA